MVNTYSICPIATTLGPRDESQYTYRMNIGVPSKTAVYIWYIDGSQPKTIVDAGLASSPQDTKLASLDNPLNKLGMKPEDIEIVILTHLHRDHISLGHLFKKARFIVQKKELDYARNAHPIDAAIYDKSTFEGLNLELIEGGKEIIPGVSVFPTPGHSPGGQSVEINTSAGKAIITGFCCHLSTFEQTEWMKSKGWEVSAPLIHQDVREVYDSALKVKRRADIIIAIHDAAYVGKERIP